MEFGGGRKRGKPESGHAGNGDFKKSREEMESYSSGVGSKSKPCLKFFSTSGCSFGEACHFLHYVPGYSATVQLTNMGGSPALPVGRNAPFSDGPAPTVKTKMCNKFDTAEGCRFGDKCHFAHSEIEIGKPVVPGFDFQGMGPVGRIHDGPVPGFAAATNFGTSSTAKISIDASLAGAIIGRNGVNSKQICRLTGVKLTIKDHDTDPNLRNIELEGSFDQINQASSMVRQLISSLGASTGRTNPPSGPTSRYKRKMCENFAKGSCTFGEKCHFAHGDSELQKPYP